MSVIAEIRARSPGFPLSDSLQTVSEMELDIVQEAGTDPECPYLLFWAHGDDFEAFDDALERDETVTEIRRYSSTDEHILYRVRITEAADVVSYPLWVEMGAERIDAGYCDGWWHAKMRLPDRDALTTIEEWCTANEVVLDIECVYTDESEPGSPVNLTAEQREVLRTALDIGYFQIPRQGNMADIADELGISSQAVSERLRRGHRRLVQQYLGPKDRT